MGEVHRTWLPQQAELHQCGVLLRWWVGYGSFNPLKTRKRQVRRGGCAIKKCREATVERRRRGGYRGRYSGFSASLESWISSRGTTPALRATPPNLGGEFGVRPFDWRVSRLS